MVKKDYYALNSGGDQMKKNSILAKTNVMTNLVGKLL